mmetsp:Transcript_61657/g.133530  ORF Transcript_61657/g.133530 Transcript_61657/m.133530 type:complete len:85 (-) Transcript_61657:1399-1653(-)
MMDRGADPLPILVASTRMIGDVTADMATVTLLVTMAGQEAVAALMTAAARVTVEAMVTVAALATEEAIREQAACLPGWARQVQT